MNERESRYTVSLRTVLNGMGLLFDEDHSLDEYLTENCTLTLQLHGGNGSYEIKRGNGAGSSMPVYIYHPNDGLCEGDGICEWCGTTLW